MMTEKINENYHTCENKRQSKHTDRAFQFKIMNTLRDPLEQRNIPRAIEIFPTWLLQL